MQQNPKIIEELKKAGEELKIVSEETEKSQAGLRIQPSIARRSLAAELPKKTPSFRIKQETSSKQVTEKIDLSKKLEEYQKEISQELSALERTYQQAKELEKRLGERIELLKGLQTKGIEINKELKEFQEQLALAKKENSGLLDEVKNKLGKES